MDRKVREAVGCSRASEKRCQLELGFEGVDASARADHSGSKQGISSIVGTDVYYRIAGSDYSPNNTADLTIIAAKEMRASSVGIGQIRVDEINTTPPCSCQGHTLARPTNDPKAAESVLSAG